MASWWGADPYVLVAQQLDIDIVGLRCARSLPHKTMLRWEGGATVISFNSEIEKHSAWRLTTKA
jgi:hypothetical protein